MAAEHLVAVDLGGTLTKIGRSGPDGIATEVERVRTERVDGVVPVAWLASLIADRVGGGGAGYAVAVPGIIDSADQVVRAAPNLGWTDVPLGRELSQALRLPGVVGHDVRAAGFAEWRRGSGVGTDNLLFCSLGTGIAGAMVVDGRLLHADGYAGELGHLRVTEAAEQRCACGLFGCLETVASAAGVVRSYLRLTGRAAAAEAVADRARQGEQAAQQCFVVAAAALAEALAAYVCLAGPELVIVGGGLAGAADLLLDRVERALEDRLSFHRRPRLVPAALGPDAGLIGAALAGWERLGRSPA